MKLQEKRRFLVLSEFRVIKPHWKSAVFLSSSIAECSLKKEQKEKLIFLEYIIVILHVCMNVCMYVCTYGIIYIVGYVIAYIQYLDFCRIHQFIKCNPQKLPKPPVSTSSLRKWRSALYET